MFTPGIYDGNTRFNLNACCILQPIELASNGSIKLDDRPIATQFLTQDFSKQPASKLTFLRTSILCPYCCSTSCTAWSNDIKLSLNT